jgi:metal transporter CNNM
VPWERVFCLSTADALDERLLAVVMASGYSRIPVYEQDDPAHVKGFLLVKRLIVVDPAARRPVGSLALRRPLVVSPECGLIDLLNAFQVCSKTMYVYRVVTHTHIYTHTP